MNTVMTRDRVRNNPATMSMKHQIVTGEVNNQAEGARSTRNKNSTIQGQMLRRNDDNNDTDGNETIQKNNRDDAKLKDESTNTSLIEGVIPK